MALLVSGTGGGGGGIGTDKMKGHKVKHTCTWSLSGNCSIPHCSFLSKQGMLFKGDAAPVANHSDRGKVEEIRCF